MVLLTVESLYEKEIGEERMQSLHTQITELFDQHAKENNLSIDMYDIINKIIMCREGFGFIYQPLLLSDYVPVQQPSEEVPVNNEKTEDESKSPLHIRIPIPKQERMVIKVNTKRMAVIKDEDFESESVSSSVDEEELMSDDYEEEEEEIIYQRTPTKKKQTRKRADYEMEDSEDYELESKRRR